MIEEKCIRCGKRVGLVSITVSLFLGIFKLAIGIRTGSHALMANAFYSIQDVISSVFVFLSTRISSKEANERYPYGYGKLEYITTSSISIGIITGVLVIMFLAGRSVFEVPRHPGMLAFWVAVFSFFTTLMLSKYLKCAGTIFNSPAIISNAEHVNLDTISSFCIGIVIIITIFGFRRLDPIVAIFEAFHIVITSAAIFGRGVKGLMDSSLSKDEKRKIRETITAVKDVKGISSLKTRQLGREKQIDCEIELEGTESLIRADVIKKEIRNSLSKTMPLVSVINISIAPFEPSRQTDKKETAKIIKILSGYYRHFIERHELKISEKCVELSLFFLPETPVATCQGIHDRIKEQIKHDITEKEVSIIINPGKN